MNILVLPVVAVMAIVFLAAWTVIWICAKLLGRDK